MLRVLRFWGCPKSQGAPETFTLQQKEPTGPSASCSAPAKGS